MPRPALGHSAALCGTSRHQVEVNTSGGSIAGAPSECTAKTAVELLLPHWAGALLPHLIEELQGQPACAGHCRVGEHSGLERYLLPPLIKEVQGRIPAARCRIGDQLGLESTLMHLIEEL